ncbi:hypothetical protein EAF04_001497 [Stromatinia cepivora]|nr:hypothetical protein EAF04_001497 [Stromatinia cepivora]
MYLESSVLSNHLVALGCCALLLWLLKTKTHALSLPAVAKDVRKRVKNRIALVKYPFTAKETIQEAITQAKGSPVQLISPESLVTFVTSPKHIKDIANAANDELSLHAAAKKILKPEYTMNGFNWHDKRGVDGIGFVRALRTLLTNHLPHLTTEVRELIDHTFKEELGDGVTANAMHIVKIVATKFTAYSFFGPDVMGDEKFMDAALYYNHDVMLGSEILRLCPRFLVPIVGAFIPLFLRRQQTFYYGLTSIFEKRLSDTDKSKKYEDVIQWIIDTSPKTKTWTSGRMAFEIMAIWFGSVEGLSTTLLFAVYNLCSYPEYMAPLREELESEAADDFYKTGEGLPLMDSFLKESSRWTPVESVSTRRCALKDFTFFDGTHVKKGDWVCVPVGAMLGDAENYPQPDVFHGFRFADPKIFGKQQSIQPEGPSKFTDISDKWQVWGTGKILCPGRFFVGFAMKHIMAHIINNYDPELVDKNSKPTMNWRTWTLPKPSVKINFKPRV